MVFFFLVPSSALQNVIHLGCAKMEFRNKGSIKATKAMNSSPGTPFRGYSTKYYLPIVVLLMLISETQNQI